MKCPVVWFRKYKRRIIKIFKCTMCYFLKISVKLIKRILRLTTCEVICFGLLLFILFFFRFCMYGDNKSIRNVGNPKIMWWTTGFPGTSGTITCANNVKCDCVKNTNNELTNNVKAYLFYASNIKFDNLPLPRRPNDVIWGLYHEESPRNVEELLHEKTLNLFNYSTTFSRYSDIPFPLQYLDTLEDITSIKYFKPVSVKRNLLKQISPVLYLQSDCETATERDAYVKELMKLIEIDSYGACLNNKEMPKKFREDYLNNLNEEEFLHYISRYMFVLAIENGVCDDYITEKLWRAIKIGAVPIYFGSPTIRDWLPNNKSAILVEDFPTPEKMSNFLKTLLSNGNLYEEYITHKTKEEITNKRLIEELKLRLYQLNALDVAAEFECFICEKLHDKSKTKVHHIVDKKHYNCPKPISALTLQVNPSNDWVYSWEVAKKKAEDIYNEVFNI